MKLWWLVIAACILVVIIFPSSLLAPSAGLVGMLCCIKIVFTEGEEEDVQ